MQCPRCGEKQRCSCCHCSGKNHGKIVNKWDETGEIHICGRCEFSAHADWWLDEEYRQNWKVLAGAKYRPKASILESHIKAIRGRK